MIAVDLQPVSIVEDTGFRAFVRELDPRYTLPSRRSLMRTTLPELFQNAQASVKLSLEEADDITLTTDIWTSRASEAYMSLTCHFIDKNWQIRSYILDTSHLVGSHTADVIAKTLTTVIEEWGISRKIQAVVTDNAANMVAGTHIAGLKQFPCFAHTLNLVVKDSLRADQTLAVVLEKCSSIVSYFHHSAKASDKLIDIQKQQSLPEHKLIISVETRWNSVYYMLQRIEEQNPAITTALCILGRHAMCLDEDELAKVKAAITALQPFEEVTREISTEKFVSLSKIIPLTSLLMKASVAMALQGNSLADKLLQQSIRRFSNSEKNFSLSASTFLDPRFKSLTFKNSETTEMTKRKLMREMQMTKQNENEGHPDEPLSGNQETSPTISKGIWASFDNKREKLQQERSAASSCIAEMRRYSEELIIARRENPLEWWQKRGSNLESLNRLAKKYLGIVATSVPSERLFSKAGEVVSARRSCIKPSNVNMILFLNSFMDRE